MSVSENTVAKQPFKLLEIPLSKFTEDVIPHHQRVFEEHRIIVSKLLSQNNTEQVSREVKNKKHVIKQLKDLMYELDTLRAQVEKDDLDRFDSKTLYLRKIIINLISGYTDLEKKNSVLEQQLRSENLGDSEESPFVGASQIQLQGTLDEIKLKQQQDLLNQVETIQKETVEINEIFTNLGEMVQDQRQYVEKVEEEIEHTQENVESGLRHLIKARKLKLAAYPVTGACLGTLIGGPIGLIAGFKIGGLTALGCAVAGYAGARMFKKSQESAVKNEDADSSVIVGDDTQEKKHI